MPQRFRKFGHVELSFVNEKGPANRACWLQAAMSRSASGGAGMIRSSQVIFSLGRCFSARRAVNLLAATPVVAEQSKAIKLRAAMIVTIAVYALAVGGSAFLNISAPILEGVPLWFLLKPHSRTARYCTEETLYIWSAYEWRAVLHQLFAERRALHHGAISHPPLRHVAH